MTRINCVPPTELHHKHLVAEYRELPRVFALANASWQRGETPDDKRNPTNYVLGSGHVRFFYPRLGYLKLRFAALVSEMRARGYQPAYLGVPDFSMPVSWCLNWQPDANALATNRARLALRLPA